MAEPIDTNKQSEEVLRLRDEIEQLRTSLEASIEDNARLVDDRDRLLARVTTLARDLQAANTAYAANSSVADEPVTSVQTEKLSQSEEELRVAFEELQVLTEELEAANTSLHLVNRDLDVRVEERTREIAEANAALRVSETSMRAIADVVPDLLWRAENNGAITWYNTRWYDYTGQTPAPPWAWAGPKPSILTIGRHRSTSGARPKRPAGRSSTSIASATATATTAGSSSAQNPCATARAGSANGSERSPTFMS
jgi:PAS domain-containing protein